VVLGESGVYRTLLEQIHEPQDLKKLSEEELFVLTNEIRTFLIDSIAKTGGHFGANLGVVELTVALHRVYNSPTDKIIWDVGHQSYVHKMLTGRLNRFDTLRKFHGMAGFPRRHESNHDIFGAGHASTSISAGVGMAVARDLTHQGYHVISVIGDGALTGGMAMEALNHAGHLRTDMTVILNDNEMSIAENVGGMSRYLTRLRTDPNYSKAKIEIEQMLKRLPAIGERLSKTFEWTKDSLRQLLLPGQLFEAFGFKYLGPVDGHNLLELIRVIEDAKFLKGPVLIHIVTKKGKGYASAENAPDKFHAWPSAAKPKEVPSYTSVFANTITQLAREDSRIVAVTPAMVPGSGLTKFGQEFPNRLYDVGIAEQHAATFCAGLAVAGMKPVLAIYSTFMQRAYDQIIHDICIQNLPVVLAVDRAGLVGPDGETHQGAFDVSFLRTIPNISIMMPKDENELRHMLKTAMTMDGPVAVRYPRTDGMGVPMDEKLQVLPIGKSETLQDGQDVALLALGTMVPVAVHVAELLMSRYGTSATVVNLRFVKPLDVDVLTQLAAASIPIVTMEEGSLAGGVGSAILECLADVNLHVPVKRFGLPDRFVEHGSRSELLADLQLDAESVALAVHEFLSETVHGAALPSVESK